jgi:chromosome segregation ATPase
MRIALTAALLAAFASTAVAQEYNPGRPGGRPGRGSFGHRPPPRSPDDEARMCSSRRNVLATEQSRYESYKSDLVGIESELAQLQRRMDDLRKQREEAKKNFAYAESRYKGMEKDYARECLASEDCNSYDTQASALDQQTATIETSLDAVRTEIGRNRDDIARLERGIAPLQREYNDKRCNSLVPGETDQVVIERCMGIFSEWNRLQSELNRQNARVPDLRSRYEQLYSELKGLESRAASYETYLARNCTSSPQIVKMREFGDRRVRARTVGDELDKLVSDITRVRGVKITVQAR